MSLALLRFTISFARGLSMVACRIIFLALFLCASQSAHCKAAAAPWSAAKPEQLQMALAMVQQLRDCDIARWESNHDSASDLGKCDYFFGAKPLVLPDSLRFNFRMMT